MSKHTPGPWNYAIPEDGFVSCEGGQICRRPLRALNPRRGTWEANARLIAAAPELLDALESALSVIQSEYPESKWANYGVPKIRAAIDKAEGVCSLEDSEDEPTRDYLSEIELLRDLIRRSESEREILMEALFRVEALAMTKVQRVLPDIAKTAQDAICKMELPL